MTCLGSNDEVSNHRIYKKNIDFHLSMNFENDVYFGEDNLSLLNSSFANDISSRAASVYKTEVL